MHPVDILRAARDIAAHAPDVWPGFRLDEQVLVVTVPDSGPVYALGPDAGAEPGFEPMPEEDGVFVRRGPPPDDFSGMSTDLSWGASGTATMVPYGGENVLGFLLHEAFHTFQASLEGEERFAGGGGNVAFPDTSVDALALLNLEGRLLVGALAESSDAEAERLARQALAIRARRCRGSQAGTCDGQRGLEQREGAAEYVEWRLLEMAGWLDAPVDSLRSLMTQLGDDSRLDRFHFYNSGQSWMRLLDRLAGVGWKNSVETRPPDQVLAMELGPPGPELEDVALSGADAKLADREARNFLAAAEARRDSIVDAFWSQPGLPLRVRLDRGPNRATGDPDAVQAVVREDGDDVYYVVDLKEARHWYPGELEMTTVVRNGVRIGGCPEVAFCLTAIAPVEGQSAVVDGRPVPLDRPGEASGAVVVELPSFSFRSDRANLRVFADSISISAQVSADD